MAKLELFLSQPLLSMAAVLSLFLLTSGIGSAIYPRVAHLADTRRLAPAVAILVLLTMTFLGYAGANWLALPIVVKLLIAAIAIAPLGLALGLFYPHIVSCLVDGKRDGTVAISYGLSTLASVVGSSFAMTAMIETGFDALLLQAVALYVGLTVLAWVYAAAGGRWLRRSVG